MSTLTEDERLVELKCGCDIKQNGFVSFTQGFKCLNGHGIQAVRGVRPADFPQHLHEQIKREFP